MPVEHIPWFIQQMSHLLAPGGTFVQIEHSWNIDEDGPIADLVQAVDYCLGHRGLSTEYASEIAGCLQNSGDLRMAVDGWHTELANTQSCMC